MKYFQVIEIQGCVLFPIIIWASQEQALYNLMKELMNDPHKATHSFIYAVDQQKCFDGYFVLSAVGTQRQMRNCLCPSATF